MTASDMVSLAHLMLLNRLPLALRLASLTGRYQLRRMLKGGLPQSLHSPLLFLLNRRLGSEDYQVVRRIEGLRSEMAKRKDEFVANPQPGHKRLRSLNEIAQVSSVHPQWGTLLYLCANSVGAKTILELGTGAGISGCYLASGKHCQRFITIEGCPELARLAEAHLRQNANNFELLNASFSEALDKVLPTLGEGIDMAYIDGSKDKLANLHYFERLTPYLNNGCVVVFDDIHWSSEMREMWKVVKGWKGFSCTINAGRVGVCVWSGGTVQPKTYRLCGVAGMHLYEVRPTY